MVDAASRLRHTEDWSLKEQVFEQVVACFGRPDVDLMASQRTRKCPMFISYSKWDREAIQVNALAQDVSWKGWKRPYCFPPLALVGQVLGKIRQEELDEVILIVPWWPRKPYFSILMSMVTKIRRLHMEKDLLVDVETGPLSKEGIKKLKLIACVVSGKGMTVVN